MEAVKLLTKYKSELQSSGCSIPSQPSLCSSSLPPIVAPSLHASRVSLGPDDTNLFQHNQIFPTDESLETTSHYKRSASTLTSTATVQTSPKRPRMEGGERGVLPSAPPPPNPFSVQNPIQSTSPVQLPPVCSGGSTSLKSVNIEVSRASSGLVGQPEDRSGANEVVFAKPPPYNPFVASQTNLSLPVAFPQQNQHFTGVFPQQNQCNPSASSLKNAPPVSGAFPQQHQSLTGANSFEQPRTANNTGEIYTEPRSEVGQEAAGVPCIPRLPLMHNNDPPPVSVDPLSVPLPVQQVSVGMEDRVRTVYSNCSLPGYPSPREGQHVLLSREVARISSSRSPYVREGQEAMVPATAGVAMATSPISHLRERESRHQNSLNRSSPPGAPQADDEIRDEESNTSNADGESSDEDPSEGGKVQEKPKESVTATRKKGWLSWFTGRST